MGEKRQSAFKSKCWTDGRGNLDDEEFDVTLDEFDELESQIQDGEFCPIEELLRDDPTEENFRLMAEEAQSS